MFGSGKSSIPARKSGTLYFPVDLSTPQIIGIHGYLCMLHHCHVHVLLCAASSLIFFAIPSSLRDLSCAADFLSRARACGGGGGGRRVAQEGVRDRGTQARQQTGGGATQTHRTREPHQEGQGRAQQTRRRGTARQERQPKQREQGTRMEGMGERAHGRQRQQRMVWPASPVATGCQGNPCSTGIRWRVSPAAQMGCLRNRSGSPSGADQL